MLKILDCFGWTYYLSGKEEKLDKEKCGKWMYFFDNNPKSIEFVKDVCTKAIVENICYECKHTNFNDSKLETGVACFYLNADDIENHKIVIQFMLDNNLIPRVGMTKIGNKNFSRGRLKNISFKFDAQTRAGEYGSNFEGKIKLDSFIDLKTGQWIKK